MLTLHRAAFVLPDPADPTAPSHPDGAVLVRGELVEAIGPYGGLAAAHPGARVREWGRAVLAPGLCNPYGHWLLERAYHPDPREEIGVEPVADGLVGSTDETRCGASARRGLQRMLGFGVTAVAGPFRRASVRTAVARSGVVALTGTSSGAVGAAGTAGAVGAWGVAGVGGGAGAGGGAGGAGDSGAGPLDPLAVLSLAEAVHGRLTVGGRADFAVFAVFASAGEEGARPAPGGCLATVLGGRLVYRRR
ncbi:hypothetical protein [Streptomyces sp. NRRL S-350]|uniref:amidohydrolase family protein n=1 Tax=Streptomyces sp. NRRL S-350 TaxID=1463902 RepID=UPI0004C26BA5|nr:hypothetical protein [Streptomyces sp. NRRL S-350]